MPTITSQNGYHDAKSAEKAGTILPGQQGTQFTYRFENFFHPFVGELIAAGGTEVPETLRDAALARAVRLSANGRVLSPNCLARARRLMTQAWYSHEDGMCPSLSAQSRTLAMVSVAS